MDYLFPILQENSICCGQSDLACCNGCWAIGFMIGSGGSAIVAKTLGEGKKKKANEYFSMLIFTALIGATILSVFGFIFISQICMDAWGAWTAA